MRVSRRPAFLFLLLLPGVALPGVRAQPAAAAAGLLWAQGYAGDGRLGDGRTFGVATPVAAGVAATAGGYAHTLILNTDGTLWGAGLNHLGQLGNGSSAFYEPLPVRIAENVSQIAAGEHHSLFLKTDGTLWAVGDNSDGQLGDGTTTSRRRPVLVASDVTAIAAGTRHSLWVRADGMLWGAGRNSDGRLGDGTGQSRVVPVSVATNVRRAAAGGTFSLFIKTDGTLWGTGYAAWLPPATHTPIQITANVTASAAGQEFALFLTTDATLWGLGHNVYGNLGDGTGRTATTPVQIARGVTAVATGSRHTAFIKSDGTLWATGSNDYGQLGDGTLTARFVPVQIASGVRAVGAGEEFTLYVLANGTLMSVGLNNYGQLATGSTWDRVTPLLVASGVTKVATSFNANHTLFLDAQGGLWAMGDNSSGELADGTTTRRTSPVQVATDVIDVAVGTNHTLYVKRDGTLWAVGGNSWGQLGDGTTTRRASPIEVARNVVAVAAGGSRSLYIDRDGSVWFMGHYGLSITSDGRLYTATPVRLQLGGTVAVAAGSGHALFLSADGSLWGFGNNEQGQLGNGATGYAAGWITPRVLAENVRSMVAGAGLTFFIKTDRTLWGMGSNGWGGLGDGTTTNRTRPVQVATGIQTVATGGSHNLFLNTDGTVWATGWVGDGGFDGNGELITLGTPVQVASGVAGIAAGAAISYTLTLPGTCAPPVIVTPPAATEFAVGSRVTLSVTTAGGTPVDFRWRKDGNDVPSERSDRLILPCAQRADAGQYDVVVTNSAGSVTSVKAAVSIHVATIVASPPPAVTLVPGADLILDVTATSAQPLTYQWKKDGNAIPGATGPRLQIANMQPDDAGEYAVTITSADGAVTLTPTVVEMAGSRIANLSVRTLAGQGDLMLIVGFATGGRRAAGNARLLARGVGPSLAAFGIEDYLADPSLTVLQGSTLIARNDDWAGATDLVNAARAVGAFPLAGPGSRDAALLASSPPGSYTAQVGTVGDAAGNALVEIYDLNAAGSGGVATAPQLVNVSARARAGGASGPLIAGFVITGTGSKNVLLRATGPALAGFGVTGALADPKLEVFRSGVAVAVAANDNWSGQSALVAAFAQVGAFPLDPRSADAALIVQLPPGAYTAEISGTANTSGVALMEVYDLNP